MRHLIAGTLSALTLTGIAMADDMFASVETVSASNGETTIRFSHLNPEIMRMSPGDQIDLNFGPGYVAELDRVGVQSMGAEVWVGRLAGETIHRRVVLTETNGFVFGSISTDDGVWYVVPEGNGHRIMQFNNGRELEVQEDTLLPDPTIYANIVDEMENSGVSAGDIDVAQAVPVGSNGTIDIAVFYSQSFEARWGLASGGRVQYMVALLDQALIDSDTGLRANLVLLDSVNLTTDSADQSVTLQNLSNNPNNSGSVTVTQDLSAQRNAAIARGADLTAIVQRSLTGQSSCGLAWGIGQPASNGVISAGVRRYGYSVTADWITDTDTPSGSFSFCSEATFAHEIGHNMGFAHNVENSSGGAIGGVRTYAHGHRVDGSFRTIMSYNSGIGEPRVNYFSNPEINLCPNGAACGIAAPGGVETAASGIDAPHTEDPADNARAAREEGRNVTTFYSRRPEVYSAVLPVTRTVVNGQTASAFMTITNPSGVSGYPFGAELATNCGVRLAGTTGAQFSYQTTDPNTNALTGTVNTPVNIAAGQSQTYAFFVTSASTFEDNLNTPGFFPSGNVETDLYIEAFCDNFRSAPYSLGLNSLTFRSTASQGADIVALSATLPANPGYVVVPTTGGQEGVFAVAISNVGAAASITVSADTGSQSLAVSGIEICPTDINGACTVARASTQNLNVGANGTASFNIYVTGNGGAIANDPATNRVFVRFAESGNAVGATSVAVRTQ